MIAAVFPGQGSQKPGMGRELCETFPVARGIFEQVSHATSIDVARLCFEADEDELRQTANAQLALYTCGLAAWAVLTSHCDVHRFEVLAGHSVGEYTALAAADVLSVADGARAVQTRGRLMRESGQKWPGTMAAVIGMDRSDLEAVCAEVEGRVVVANDNCPGQLVISGEAEAVAKAGELAKSRGAKRVLPLNVSGAFHSPLMEEPAEEMGKELRTMRFEPGIRMVYSNVTSQKILDSEDWAGLLERQLRNPVRWTESVQNMIADGVEAFVECGVGEVLSGLIRRIDREAMCLKVFDQESLRETLQSFEARG